MPAGAAMAEFAASVRASARNAVFIKIILRELCARFDGQRFAGKNCRVRRGSKERPPCAQSKGGYSILKKNGVAHAERLSGLVQ